MAEGIPGKVQGIGADGRHSSGRTWAEEWEALEEAREEFPEHYEVGIRNIARAMADTSEHPGMDTISPDRVLMVLEAFHLDTEHN